MKNIKESQLETLISNEIGSVVKLRRKLHQTPELAFHEFETSQILQDYLKETPELQIESNIAKTGFVATLGSHKSGKCIGFRADMDALPIKETSDLSYKSKNNGVMHACGHDGHSAILASLAKVLSKCSDQLKGPVKFVFQPAEEGGGGAKHMVEHGILESPKIEAMFGLHGWPSVELGKVGAVSGPCFASTNIFDIEITGAGGHAAFPHKTIDPMPIAASIIQALQTLVSRSTNPLDSSVLSICDIKGGNTYNVIPEKIAMKGTLRCFTESHRQNMLQNITKMSESIASGFGASATIQIKDVGYPVLINDSNMTHFWKSIVENVYGEQALDDVQPTMGGEDFAYYAEKVPSCLWFLGVKDPENDSYPQLHTSNYDFNDRSLEIGIRLQAEAALRFQSH